MHRIVIINDELYVDEFAKMVMMESGDVSMQQTDVDVLSIEKAIEEFGSGKYSEENVLLIFREPLDAVTFIKKGSFKPKELNVANVGKSKSGREKFSRSLGSVVYLSKEEREALKELEDSGIPIIQQVMATSERKKLEL